MLSGSHNSKTNIEIETPSLGSASSALTIPRGRAAPQKPQAKSAPRAAHIQSLFTYAKTLHCEITATSEDGTTEVLTYDRHGSAPGAISALAATPMSLAKITAAQPMSPAARAATASVSDSDQTSTPISSNIDNSLREEAEKSDLPTDNSSNSSTHSLSSLTAALVHSAHTDPAPSTGTVSASSPPEAYRQRIDQLFNDGFSSCALNIQSEQSPLQSPGVRFASYGASGSVIDVETGLAQDVSASASSPFSPSTSPISMLTAVAAAAPDSISPNNINTLLNPINQVIQGSANLFHTHGSRIIHGILVMGAFILAVAAALPTAFNALAQTSGITPEQISAEWWKSMSVGTTILSVAEGVSSLSINTMLNIVFLLAAGHTLYLIFKAGLTSTASYVALAAAVTLALGGAASAGAIAYDSFIWFNMDVAIAITGLAALMTLVQRFVGATGFMKRAANLNNPDALTQRELIDCLQHLDDHFKNSQDHTSREEFLTHFEAYLKVQFPYKNRDLAGAIESGDAEAPFIRNPNAPITDDEYRNILVKSAAFLTGVDDTDGTPIILKGHTACENFGLTTAIMIDASLAICAFIPALMVFMEKGYDAALILSDLWFHHTLKRHLATEVAIGIIPGLASALMYMNSALSIRTILTEVSVQLFTTPTCYKWSLGIGLAIANVLASTGMENVAKGVVIHPNMFNIEEKTTLGALLMYSTAFAGLMVNAGSSVTLLFPKRDLFAKDLTLETITQHLASRNHILDKESGNQIRAMSFFTKRRDAEARAQEAARAEERKRGYITLGN